MPDNHFADRLRARIRKTESLLAVGLDPRPLWFPEEVRKNYDMDEQSSPGEIARAVEQFDELILEIAADLVPAVKIQIGFYEQLGPPGIRVFRRTLNRAREAGLIVIADVKRSDIGSTASAYARGFFGSAPGDEEDPEVPSYDPPFPCDAVTLNPFFGHDGIEPFIDSADRTSGGLFFLVKTSNPGSRDIQDLETNNGPVYLRIANLLDEYAEERRGNCGYSNIGAVVGATQPEAFDILRNTLSNSILLTPGIGAQGGSSERLASLVDDDGMGCLVPMARSIIYAYRDQPEKDWKQAIRNRIHHWNRTFQTLL